MTDPNVNTVQPLADHDPNDLRFEPDQRLAISRFASRVLDWASKIDTTSFSPGRLVESPVAVYASAFVAFAGGLGLAAKLSQNAEAQAPIANHAINPNSIVINTTRRKLPGFGKNYVYGAANGTDQLTATLVKASKNLPITAKFVLSDVFHHGVDTPGALVVKYDARTKYTRDGKGHTKTMSKKFGRHSSLVLRPGPPNNKYVETNLGEVAETNPNPLPNSTIKIRPNKTAVIPVNFNMNKCVSWPTNISPNNMRFLTGFDSPQPGYDCMPPIIHMSLEGTLTSHGKNSTKLVEAIIFTLKQAKIVDAPVAPTSSAGPTTDPTIPTGPTGPTGETGPTGPTQ